MAVGKAGEPADPRPASRSGSETCASAHGGERDPAYSPRAAASDYMTQGENRHPRRYWPSGRAAPTRVECDLTKGICRGSTATTGS